MKRLANENVCCVEWADVGCDLHARVAAELISMSAFENPSSALPTTTTLFDDIDRFVEVSGVDLSYRRIKFGTAMASCAKAAVVDAHPQTSLLFGHALGDELANLLDEGKRDHGGTTAATFGDPIQVGLRSCHG